MTKASIIRTFRCVAKSHAVACWRMIKGARTRVVRKPLAPRAAQALARCGGAARVPGLDYDGADAAPAALAPRAAAGVGPATAS